ncbi:hypothetical protein ACQPXM_02375 [Kribbella sp. CA-253562]|uniref:hypothetical protein n=1 Tax=Kribbella sp. CA-253562 TaxID=3239942 RepID=UPI003D920519
MFGWLRGRRARRDGSLGELGELNRRARALAAQGDVDGAVALIRASDNPRAERMLVLVLRDYGRLDEAIAVLRSSTSPDAAARLEQFLAERGAELARLTRVRSTDLLPVPGIGGVDNLLQRGLIDEAVELLKSSTLPADEERLRALLRELGRTDELRAMASRSVRQATLRAEGRLEEPRPATRVPVEPSDPAQDAYRLIRSYVEQGKTDEAIALLQSRPRVAPDLLADLLVAQDRVDEAVAVLDASKDRGAPRKAARLRAAHGLIDELRARADAGERPSADVLAGFLAEQGALDELRTRAADGPIFAFHLVRALGRLRRIDELEQLAGGATDGGLAGAMWWATVLADVAAEDVPAALAEHSAYSAWYAEQNGTRAVIRLLVEQGRIGIAVAFARARVGSGAEWASAWVPREDQDEPSTSVSEQMLAASAESAVRELLPGHAGDEEFSTTVSLADVDSTLYGDVRIRVPELGRVEISLACWTVGTDTARYFGDDPPTVAETELPPTGTAVPDLASTIGVIDELSARLGALEPPSPHRGGRHLTITVPLRTTTLAAVPG